MPSGSSFDEGSRTHVPLSRSTSWPGPGCICHCGQSLKHGGFDAAARYRAWWPAGSWGHVSVLTFPLPAWREKVSCWGLCLLCLPVLCFTSVSINSKERASRERSWADNLESAIPVPTDNASSLSINCFYHSCCQRRWGRWCGVVVGILMWAQAKTTSSCSFSSRSSCLLHKQKH